MNASPDTSLTFQEILVRVAEEAGYAKYNPDSPDSPAAVPTDRQLLDKLKRAVNDGVSEMFRDYPQFTCRRKVISLLLSPDGSGPFNVDGDPSRYRLPWYITGRPSGPWVWGMENQTISGEAQDVSIDRVNRQHLSIRSTGYPVMAAVAPSPVPAQAEATQDGGADRQTWEVRVWPIPQDAYFFQSTFPVASPRMVGLNERHVFGAAHDQTVIAYGVWQLKRHDSKNPAERQSYLERRTAALAGSIRLDQENVPKTLGRLRDPAAERTEGRRYFHPGLDIHAGAASP